MGICICTYSASIPCRRTQAFTMTMDPLRIDKSLWKHRAQGLTGSPMG